MGHAHMQGLSLGSHGRSEGGVFAACIPLAAGPLHGLIIFFFFVLFPRYLKKHNVRDWLRVISSNKDRGIYELRYFNIADNDAEDDE